MKRSIFSAVIGVSVITLIASSAQAAFQITLTGSSTFTVVDNGTGDTDPTLGKISFVNGTGFTMTGYSTLTVSSTSTEGANASTLSTTQLDVSSTVSQSLGIVVSNQYALPSGTPLDLEQTLGGTQNPSGTGSATVNQVSQVISGVTTTTPNSTIAVTTANRTPAGQSSGISAPRTGTTFTLATDISVAFVGGFDGQLNHNTSVLPPVTAPVPEPASLAVWGGLMISGIVGAAARRRNRSIGS